MFRLIVREVSDALSGSQLLPCTGTATGYSDGRDLSTGSLVCAGSRNENIIIPQRSSIFFIVFNLTTNVGKEHDLEKDILKQQLFMIKNERSGEIFVLLLTSSGIGSLIIFIENDTASNS